MTVRALDQDSTSAERNHLASTNCNQDQKLNTIYWMQTHRGGKVERISGGISISTPPANYVTLCLQKATRSCSNGTFSNSSVLFRLIL